MTAEAVIFLDRSPGSVVPYEGTGKETVMGRLNLFNLYSLANRLFAGHPNMAELNVLYETMEDLVPSEPLEGDSEGEDFLPDHFAAMVFHDDGVAFVSFRHALWGADGEPIDMLDHIDGMPGVAVEDKETLELIFSGAARTIAAVAARRTDDGIVSRLYRHPGIDRTQAVGFLKSGANEIREALKKGGS